MGIFKCFYSASHSLSLSTLRDMSMWLLKKPVVLRPLSLKIALESHLWNMHISHTKMNCFFESTKVLIMSAHQIKQFYLRPLVWFKVYPLSRFTLI